MPGKAAAVAVAFVLSCLTATASARGERVVVLESDEELVRAISLALAPFGFETMQSEQSPPGPRQPEAVQSASRLARNLEASALVWVTKLEQGSLLWVFEVETGDVTTRLLGETPPFDSAAAAAVALSVKTVLGDHGPTPAPEAPREPELPEPQRRRFSVAAGGGATWMGAQVFEPRGHVEGVVWLAGAGRLGLALELSLGPGVAVTDVAYEGRYQEQVLGASARFAFLRAAHFELVAALGGSARRVTLQGRLLLDDRESSVMRINPALELRTLANFHLSQRFYLGASLGGAYFPTYRRYLIDGIPVFAPPPVVASATGHAGFEWF